MSDIDTTPYRRAVLEATDEMICDVVALVRHAQAEHYADSLTHVLEAYAAMVELLGLDDFSEDDDGESIPPASFSAEEIEGVTEATAQALSVPRKRVAATISFRPEAYDSAASFFTLLTPRPIIRYAPDGVYGYTVHVVETSGIEYDAEVRDLIEVEEPDGGRYHLVVWECDDDASRGDATREHTLDIYDDIARVEVIYDA